MDEKRNAIDGWKKKCYSVLIKNEKKLLVSTLNVMLFYTNTFSKYDAPLIEMGKDNDTLFHIPRQRRWQEGFAEQRSQTRTLGGIGELKMAIDSKR